MYYYFGWRHIRKRSFFKINIAIYFSDFVRTLVREHLFGTDFWEPRKWALELILQMRFESANPPAVGFQPTNQYQLLSRSPKKIIILTSNIFLVLTPWELCQAHPVLLRWGANRLKCCCLWFLEFRDRRAPPRPRRMLALHTRRRNNYPSPNPKN